jgi:hypothetical protein
VEAKGGRGRLITREVAPGVHAQQGTVAYLRSVIRDMKKQGGRSAAVAREIEDALTRGEVRYFVSKTPVGSEALTTTLQEFRVR